MGDEFRVDPDALRMAAGQMDEHAAGVASHGAMLRTSTAGSVGRGAIGELVESVVRRSLRLVAEDLSAAVSKFYGDAAVVMRTTASETEQRDSGVKLAFDGLACRVPWAAVREPTGADIPTAPWTHDATKFTPSDAVEQSSQGSCVSACGEMLSNGRYNEAEILQTIGEWSNPESLAAFLNGGADRPWRGGSVGVPLQTVLARGPVGIEFKVYGAEAHMVVAQLQADSTVLIRDPALGASYLQPIEVADRFWNMRAIFR